METSSSPGSPGVRPNPLRRRKASSRRNKQEKCERRSKLKGTLMAFLNIGLEMPEIDSSRRMTPETISPT